MSQHERWEPVPTPRGPDPVGEDGRVAIYRRLTEDFAHCHGEVPEETRRQMAMLAAASVRALLSELAALNGMSK